jgi:hypothetical protein
MPRFIFPDCLLDEGAVDCLSEVIFSQGGLNAMQALVESVEVEARLAVHFQNYSIAMSKTDIENHHQLKRFMFGIGIEASTA